MKKIISIVANPDGIYALTESGELYFGYFVSKGPLHKPTYGWRKVPPIPDECYGYKSAPELTELELSALRKKAEKDAKRGTAKL